MRLRGSRCAQNRNRTSDTRIFSPLLYQLSYLGVLRGKDLNQRPSGYEPDELPDCSTPLRYEHLGGDKSKTKSAPYVRCMPAPLVRVSLGRYPNLVAGALTGWGRIRTSEG